MNAPVSVHYSDPPILLENVFADPSAVVSLLEANAPYTPLGGWYRPDNEDGEALSAMWFQQDWLHAGEAVEGAELFLEHSGLLEASKNFYDAEVVKPYSLYVNLMAAIAESGPAHTDNPAFRGRDRSNTPMFLLRTMLWSGLFERWLRKQATSIWWLNDVSEGGGLRYWPEGPDKPPHRHVGEMANTSLVGDNHGMFHQVEPVGPLDKGTLQVSANASLAPANDGSDDWVVSDRGEECYRAPLSQIRVSVLMKADVYKTEEDYQHAQDDLLSMEEVVRRFNEDLQARGIDFKLELEKIEDAAHLLELAKCYPEPEPIDAGVSIFDAYK